MTLTEPQIEVVQMKSLKKQQGLTFISWLVILVVAGFFVMVGIKINQSILNISL